MTEILFVRHGHTAQNGAKVFQGHSDTNLDETGRWQADRVARRLAVGEIAAIYTSDLARARQTAAPLACALGLDVTARRDLREIDVGEAVGLGKAELMERYPALFSEDWPSVPFPGGESYRDTTARISSAACEIADAHRDQTVVVFTHGGSIRAAVAGLAAIPIETLSGLFVQNTSITRISIDRRGHGRLLALNDTAHLEPWATEIFAPNKDSTAADA